MPADIVARLSVDSRDLSAGINSAFAEINARSKSNASELENTYSATYRSLTGTAKREFAQAFREINNLASNASSQISSAAGGGFDASSARAAANASAARSAALQQFVATSGLAAGSLAELNREERVYIAAAQTALRESVAETNALNAKAAALERLTGGLAQTNPALARARVSAGQYQAGLQQLGFQVSDVAQGLSQKGVSAITVFSQQAPQFIQAVQLMTNKTTGFLGALAGFPGIIGVAAISLGARLYESLNKAGDGVDALGNKEKSLTERIREQNEELKRNIQLQGQRLAVTLQEAKQRANDQQGVIFDLRRKLAGLEKRLLEADARSLGGGRGSEAAIGQASALRAQITSATAELEAALAAKEETERDVKRAQIPLIQREVASRLDPVIAETNRHEEALQKLSDALVAGSITEKKFRADLAAEEALHKKNKKALEDSTAARQAANGEIAKSARLSKFISPINLNAPGVRVSSEVGVRTHPIKGGQKFHAGRDIAAPAGTTVAAAAEGTVIHVGKLGGYGNVIIVDHGNGISTKYAHLLDSGDVKVGDQVGQGQAIARVGSTGNSTGNHLHYEVRKGDPFKGRALNPAAGQFAIDPGSADASAAAQAAKEAAKEAERAVRDRAEILERINGDLAKEGIQISHNAQIEELRRKGLDVQADKEQAIYDLRNRYSDLIANDKNLTAADRAELEKKLEITKQLVVADIDRRAAAEAAIAANDNTKRIREDIEADIADERERQRLQALRLAGLQDQAEQEEAILQYRQRYADLLKGSPEDAARLLKITKEQVIEERARVQKSEGVILEGIEVDQQRNDIDNLASYYERAFSSGGKSIWDDFRRRGERSIAGALAQFTKSIKDSNPEIARAFNEITGDISNGIAASSLARGVGVRQSTAGAAAGGYLGAGVGSLFGPGGKAIGGFLGGLFGGTIGGLFKKKRRGSATLAFNNGSLGVGVSSGRREQREQSEEGIEQLSSSLEDIAAQLGGTISGAGSVSIGVRKKKFVVDTSGRGRTKGSGVLSFDNERDAIEAALRDALSDGVISGISAASQRIISSGQNLQKALEKALLIENVSKSLKARLNPVGAALDQLNDKFKRTIDALNEGAASAEQFAEARQLYNLERADILTAANDNLRDFINGLNFGANSAFSLEDQSRSARAQVDPFLAQIRSGNFAAVNQEQYLSGASEFLQIQRELAGSGSAYFAAVDEFRSASQALADGLAAQQNARDLFAETTANSTQSTAQNTQATAEILAEQSVLLQRIAASVSSGGGGGGSFGGGGYDGFIGSNREFVNFR